jgi:ferric-dicitrate binding protein FerR (iron transport regulator)
MSRRSFPHIDPATLRDHADEARVDRVWDRLEHEVVSRQAQGPLARGARRSLPRYVVYAAIAASLGAFGAGLLLGKTTWDRRPPPETVAVTPVEDKSLVEVLAAGTQLRSFPLQGGGVLTLSPGATIEVERSGGAVTLALLQGEASISSMGRPLAVVAGEARINTQAGSVVSVTRNADDLDVKVDDGAVSITSPAGSRQLGRHERAEAVPLHAVTAAAPTDTKPARSRALSQRGSLTSPRQLAAKLASVPEWFSHYPADEQLALSLLRKQGLGLAIESAHGPAELNAIAELAGKDHNQAEEIHAYERLVQRFPSDQRAYFAAERLARIYGGRGDAARAKEYQEKAPLLAQNATTGSDALFCDVIRREPDKTKAALMAKEYLAKYPDGECREDIERLVQGSAPAAAPSSSAAASADPAPPAPPLPAP